MKIGGSLYKLKFEECMEELKSSFKYKLKFEECMEHIREISPHRKEVYFSTFERRKYNEDISSLLKLYDNDLFLYFKMFVPEVVYEDEEDDRKTKFIKIVKYFLDVTNDIGLVRKKIKNIRCL